MVRSESWKGPGNSVFLLSTLLLRPCESCPWALEPSPGQWSEALARLCIHLTSVAWPWHWTVSPSFLLVWGIQKFQLIDFLISCGQNQLHMSQAACIPWASVGFEEATGWSVPITASCFLLPHVSVASLPAGEE